MVPLQPFGETMYRIGKMTIRNRNRNRNGNGLERNGLLGID